MSDKRAQILEALNRVIPQLDGQEQDRLLSFIEGMAALTQMGSRAEDEASE